ncbi:uncharacterized protein LOC143297741 isoform X2 [Babylonia areolata]|uniref:uncharacterized protein LOC143297741 isoform X2 n=1 Tax=Babylonia areolata TaxID=304850 RepID=UPI003FD1B826
MPRATRRALAEDAPSRSSPRASTRASTAAAASSSSPATTRGRRGKAEEPEVLAAVETKSRGRSSSRAKAAVTPPTPPAGRQARSRSRGAVAEPKTTPTPPKRGRGTAKKQEEEEEEEEEVVKEEEEEEEDQEKEAEEEKAPSKRGGRGQRKTKSPSTPKKATPPARSSRGSRRSAEAEVQEEPEEPKKTTPRRGRGKATPTTTPPSRSRRGRGAGEPGKQDEEEGEEAEEGTTEENAEAERRDSDSEMKESVAKGKPEEPKEKEAEKMETGAVESPEGQDAEGEKPKEDAAVTEDKTVAASAEEKKEPQEMEVVTEKKTEADQKVGASSAEKQEPENTNGAEAQEKKEEVVQENDDKAEPDGAEAEEDASKAAQAEEKETQKKSEESAPVTTEEPMEEQAPAPPVQQPTADDKNCDLDDSQPPRKLATKRKLEEDDTEETTEESDPKRARINGTDAADNTAPDVEMTESKAAADDDNDSNLLKDYDVVSKEEIPPADSAEVAAAIPPPAADSQSEQTDTTAEEKKMEESGSGEPVTVVPLTEAEVAKAYGSEVQALELGETDDVSSTIVEVGSVAGSDVTVSRGLDVSEVQSASNSVDGDDTADSSMNESSAAPEASADFVLPAPVQQTCDQPKAEVSESTPTDSAEPDATPKEPTVTNGSDNSSAVPVVDQPPTSSDLTQNDTMPSKQATSSSPPEAMETDAAPVQNSHPHPLLSKGSGSVTDVLGTPDPAFLAAYSSPGILNRAFVPNPAVPQDSVATQDTFSVVSYNILAECHRSKSTYKAPEEFLGQEYRHNLLMKELQYLDADVVCLQEVDPDYFSNTLLPAMRALGYEGLMKRRTQEYFHEGEATLYKTSVFELESSRGVSLTEVARKEVETCGLSAEVAAAINKYLDRADVVFITRLRCRATGKVVTVGNIHVVWDCMKSTDVQCIQAACAVKEVVGMCGSEGAHMVCGDFNAEWSSPVYQLMLDGYLSDSSIHTLQAVQRLELDDGAKSLVNHLWTAFQHTSSNMKSAYSTVTKSEPEVTSYSSSMKSLDYVFYSASSLVPVGVLKTIDAPVISATEGLPTKDFPSDHLSIKSVMAFCK